MTKRIRHGGKLIHQSFGVIRQHKKLFIFPMLATLLSVLLFAAVITFLIRHSGALELAQQDRLHRTLWAYLIAFLFLVPTIIIMNQIILYFNSALTHCTQQYFKGKKPSLCAGIRMANHRFFQFLLWNAFASSVGIIIVLFQNQLQKLAFYAKIFQGLRWIQAVYFITPVIVLDKTGPINAIKRSADLMRKTWGTSLRANFGFMVLLFIARLLAFAPLITGIVIGGKTNLIIGSSITVGLSLIISMIHSAARIILCSALHLYSSEELIAPGFKEELIRKAFKEVKKH